MDGRVCSTPSESCSLVSCLCVTMQHRKSHDFPPLPSCPGAVDAFLQFLPSKSGSYQGRTSCLLSIKLTLALACSKPFNSHQGHPSNRFWKRSLNVEMEKAFQQWLWGSSKFDIKRKWLAPKEITLRPVVVFQTFRVTNEKCMGQIVCKGRSAQKYQLGQAFRGGRVQKQAWEHPCRANRSLCSPHVPALLTKVKGPIRKLA